MIGIRFPKNGGDVAEVASELLLCRDTEKKARCSTSVEAGFGGEVCCALKLLSEAVESKRREIVGNRRVGISFTPETVEGEILINVNKSDFRRVISNILNNSIDAAEGAGKISVGILSESEDTRIVIEDDGRGIRESILMRLGSQHVSEGHSVTGSSSGLGVYHAFEKVREWGGHIRYDSQVGLGAKVSILLPGIEAARSDLRRDLGSFVGVRGQEVTIH